MPSLPDVVFAIAVAVFAQVDLAFGLDNSAPLGPAPLVIGSTLVATLALAWRRRFPLATALVVAIAIGGPMLFMPLTVTLWGDFLPILVAAYSVARHARFRRFLIGSGAIVAALVVVFLRNPESGTIGNVFFVAVPVAVCLVAGRVLRARVRSHSELAASRAAAIEEALAEERARIARELHDIVAHCVSVMVVQAGAAEDLLDRDPGRAREPLRSVQETGRQAVGELSRMLGLLRVPPALAPQPGTADLGDLVEHMGSIGLPVSLTITGEVRPLPPGVDLTVYRVVQESLTNALKHAAPTTARVALCFSEKGLRITATNPLSHHKPVQIGHGLIGMRERVELYGGTLSIDDTSEHGFTVTVELPLEAAR